MLFCTFKGDSDTRAIIRKLSIFVDSAPLTMYHFFLKRKNQNRYEITKIKQHPEEIRFLNWVLGKCLGLQLEFLWGKKECFLGTKNWLLRRSENR